MTEALVTYHETGELVGYKLFKVVSYPEEKVIHLNIFAHEASFTVEKETVIKWLAEHATKPNS